MANVQTKANVTATTKATATTKTRKPAKPAVKAKAKPATQKAAEREIVNKVQPIGSTNTPQPKAPAKAKATTEPAKPAQPSTGNADFDKQYGVGKVDTLPEDFRTLSAYERMERINGAEADVRTSWHQIAKYYGYSVVPVIQDLAAADKWPTKDRTNRKGEVMKDAENKPIRVPCTYKEVYQQEKDANLKAIGHWVNTAANRFSEYKPEDHPNKRKANASSGTGTNADLKPKTRKSSLELAIEYVAGLTEDEIKKFIADPFVKDALKDYLK